MTCHVTIIKAAQEVPPIFSCLCYSFSINLYILVISSIVSVLSSSNVQFTLRRNSEFLNAISPSFVLTSSGDYSLLFVSRWVYFSWSSSPFKVEYKGIPQEQFIHTWLKDAEESLKAKEDGRILQLWKVNETVLNINRPMQISKETNLIFLACRWGRHEIKGSRAALVYITIGKHTILDPE